VLSEGLVVYLSAEQAGVLAQDLFDAGVFRRWVLDLVSPGLLQMLLENTDSEFGEGVAKLKFAPENGPDFFKPYGWETVSVESTAKAAARLNRLPQELEGPIAAMPDDPTRMGRMPWSGVCLLGRVKD
jgi:hypothetical protein